MRDKKIGILLVQESHLNEDRKEYPVGSDPEEAREALDNLKRQLRLQDGWRDTFPDTRAYTYIQEATMTMSRLDQIYVNSNILETAREWSIEPSGIPGTDHFLASVKVAHEEAPQIGKGRWTMKEHVIRDKRFRTFVNEEGCRALELLKLRNRTSEHNPQTIYSTWKSAIIEMAKKRDKMIVPKCERDIKTLESELNRAQSDNNTDEQEKCEKSGEHYVPNVLFN